ncbi:MAG: glutamate--cysteine ligase, partial [Clostridiales bacterium]|nr:glutamate--cysteine ligase [Clostridiales bacterium]
YIYERGFSSYFAFKRAYEYILILFDLAKKSLNEEEKEMLIPLEKLAINKNNLSMISKKKLNKEGIDGLKWCSLNQWVKGK